MRTKHQQLLLLIEQFARNEPIQSIIDAEILAAKLELDKTFVKTGKEDLAVSNYLNDLIVLRTNHE